MNTNNDAVIEFLLNQLRQQLTNNPYKQQCEGLAHEVLSLKNQLRDMSELVDELLGTITLMNGKSSCRKWNARECEHDWVSLPGLFIDEGAADNVLPSKFCIKCSKRQFEQECSHEWSIGPSTDVVCTKCGLVVDDHRPVVYGGPLPKGKSYVVGEHGPEQSGCRKEDAQECEHEWRVATFYGVRVSPTYCRKCRLKK